MSASQASGDRKASEPASIPVTTHSPLEHIAGRFTSKSEHFLRPVGMEQATGWACNGIRFIIIG